MRGMAVQSIAEGKCNFTLICVSNVCLTIVHLLPQRQIFYLCSKDKKPRCLNGQAEAKSPLIKLRRATFPGYLLHKYHGACPGPLPHPISLDATDYIPRCCAHPPARLSPAAATPRPRPHRPRKDPS